MKEMEQLILQIYKNHKKLDNLEKWINIGKMQPTKINHEAIENLNRSITNKKIELE